MHRIAVIEDVDDNRELLRAIMEPEYEVFPFENGAAFLNTLDHHRPFDLVLLDIRMPELDGYEVLKGLKHHPTYNQVPIVALTAAAMASDREKALAAGFSDYITKPFDLDLLMSRVRNILEAGKPTER